MHFWKSSCQQNDKNNPSLLLLFFVLPAVLVLLFPQGNRKTRSDTSGLSVSVFLCVSVSWRVFTVVPSKWKNTLWILLPALKRLNITISNKLRTKFVGIAAFRQVPVMSFLDLHKANKKTNKRKKKKYPREWTRCTSFISFSHPQRDISYVH